MCQRSVAILRWLDWLDRLTFVDFTTLDPADLPVDPALAMTGMPMLTRTNRVLVGFEAIRRAMRQTPLGLLPALVLHLPGISHLSRRVYRRIAANRARTLVCAPRPPIADTGRSPDTARMTAAVPSRTDPPRPTILFVCTGNTCRSAMAQAIARDLCRDRQSSEIPQFLSAGIAASEGLGAAPEAIRTLAERDIDARNHRTRQLTPDLLARADFVYAMTESHLRAVRAMDPSARIDLLDPAGGSIPDPVGLSATIYRQTADRITEFIIQRLADLKEATP